MWSPKLMTYYYNQIVSVEFHFYAGAFFSFFETFLFALDLFLRVLAEDLLSVLHNFYSSIIFSRLICLGCNKIGDGETPSLDTDLFLWCFYAFETGLSSCEYTDNLDEICWVLTLSLNLEITSLLYNFSTSRFWNYSMNSWPDMNPPPTRTLISFPLSTLI